MIEVRFSAAADIGLLVFLFSAIASPSVCPKTSWGCYPKVDIFEMLKSALLNMK
jgi:hypothetical protein